MFLSTPSVGWDWNLPILTWEQNACLAKAEPKRIPTRRACANERIYVGQH